MEDIDTMATISLKNEGDMIWLIGGHGDHIGQSIWLREIHGMVAGDAPHIALDKELSNGNMIRRLIGEGTINAVHDISDGGLLVALTEMALAGNIGIVLKEPLDSAMAFGENQGRYLVSAPSGVMVENAHPIAVVSGDMVAMQSLDDLRTAHESFFKDWMED